MDKNFYRILKERGFIEQATDPEEMAELFDREAISAYIGFDPTAESLHVGSLIPIMALAHFQRQGHVPIALVGGGTALIGDPSGKKEMRPVLSPRGSGPQCRGLAGAIIPVSGPGRPAGTAVKQSGLAGPFKLHRISAGYRPSFQRQPDADRRIGEATSGNRPIVY